MSEIYKEIQERLRKSELNLKQLENEERPASKIFEEGRQFELKWLKQFIEIKFEKKDYKEEE